MPGYYFWATLVMNVGEENKQLLEELGVYFEGVDNMSPLSARIFGYLVLYGDDGGVSFEDLVAELGASKSSISTNLQVLQCMNIVCYHTKPGDRKRYFKIVPNYVVKRMDDKISGWLKEREIHRKIHAFKTKNAALGSTSSKEKGLAFTQTYTEILNTLIENMNDLKEKINQDH